ncbi:anthranilate synthase component 1 [Pleionea mediterranea]|uniref:Anthranilate synthase component 1 n=1 Tax=Pleionea mediterranea TaxID=523701 RepID=A0A316FNI8_9GAMM|nr:anthranilate synthase component 1 [Pleionea mediterranea]PWK50109.1 anthranilate synthase component I [Pleionea mediterranea]
MNPMQFDKNKAVTTLTKQLSNRIDVTQAYGQLCGHSTNMTALLETASISTKEHTRSLLVLSSALRIRCFGESVTVLALNANGKQLIGQLAEMFGEEGRQCRTETDSELTLSISHQSLQDTIDEQKKLSADSVLDVLRKIMSLLSVDAHNDKTTMLVGTFSFDCYQLFESLPSVATEQSFPDYDFYLADRLLVVDHINHSTRLISKIFRGDQTEQVYFDYQNKLSEDEKLLAAALDDKAEQSASLSSNGNHAFNIKDVDVKSVNVNLSDLVYSELVEQAKQRIIAGDVFQMVLARDFTLPCSNAFLAYQQLRLSNPSPYMFFVNTPEYQLFGASPESAVKYDASNRSLSIYPIAGTRRRGLNKDGSVNDDRDARIELELKNDEKEKAEHLMLVDLARNDVARVCDSGTRKIERLLEIDRYSHVMHLVSKVTGQLSENLDALSAYQACMNMGTLSGAPKVKATQLIRQFEGKHRGVYGGAMGYINAAGDMDTAIVIRSALVANNTATVSAGAGIVYDSQPKLEIKETENKAAAALQAIHRANQLVKQQTEQNAEQKIGKQVNDHG